MNDNTITTNKTDRKAPHNKGKKLFVPGTKGRGEKYTTQQKNNVLGYLRKNYIAEDRRFVRGTMRKLFIEKGVTYNTAVLWAKEAGMELPTVRSLNVR